MRLICSHGPDGNQGRCMEPGPKQLQPKHLCPYELLVNQRETHCQCCSGCTILCLPRKVLLRHPKPIPKEAYAICQEQLLTPEELRTLRHEPS